MTVRTFLDGRITLLCGDSREMMATLADASVDSIVTDPPYGIGFMGKKWDTPGALVERKAATENKWDHVGGNHNPSNSADAARTARIEGQKFGRWCEEWAREAFRVLKPGGHLLAFSGTRTYHRMACAIEDAGFEIRDQIGWAYGGGMPKGLNVGKALEARIGDLRRDLDGFADKSGCEFDELSEKLGQLEGALDRVGGWNTSLKPSWEPICIARKPLIDTVLANMLAHGVGGLNCDACRIEADARPLHVLDAKATDSNVYAGRTGEGGLGKGLDGGSKVVGTTDVGRWPANIIHDGSDEVMACFPDAPGQQPAVGPEFGVKDTVNCYGSFGPRDKFVPRGDSGSAARFFYTAKADADDRIGSKHPTVKPVDLMQYLVRLVTPKNGLVLDPFAGTGTTGEAAWREGMRAVLIEREAEYQDDIARRMDLVLQPTKRAAVAKTKNKIDDHGPLFGGAQP